MYSRKKVVCFGGGTGLPTLLSGLKHNPWLDITAVVNMFDTGGSSGELKDRFGILPPGDVLKCLLALAKHEAYARELLQTRIFNSHCPGHTGGNALLLGLEKVLGDHLSAIDALGQLLTVRGKVVPVTLKQSTLCARYVDGSIAKGETNVDLGIREGKVVHELFLSPVVNASEATLRAIREADVFCIGPGSFYTSVLPNFLPWGVKDALRSSLGKIIYIANLFTEGKGMQGMELPDFIEIVERCVGRPIDWVVYNDMQNHEQALPKYAIEDKYPIQPGSRIGRRFVAADLWADQEIARHDSARLAHIVSPLINRCSSGF